ncbi:MAG: excinuclease ABC subunit UvrA [Planctomycetales bacterium]|nr:excinuclease ABC subunit UvrA [Planctomycetales bacterium]
MPAGTSQSELTHIVIRGAREHNLKGVSVDVPKKRLVVFTGVSGSGKTSLAFDTIYAEGNRRYVESLSAYARQFLGQMEKPAYDTIRGLAPTIAIEQKTAGRSPRSTVGTITEIADYLRLLWARAGTAHCPSCGREVTSQSVEEMVADLAKLPAGAKVALLAPLVRDRKGEHRDVLREAERAGLVRVRVDGTIRSLEDGIALAKKRRHTIEAVVDRIVAKEEPAFRTRLSDSLETALRLGQGVALAAIEHDGGERRERIYSERLACVPCGRSLPDLAPAAFSFNSPQGACPSCQGIGSRASVDPDLVVPDPSKTIEGGAIRPWAGAMQRKEGWIYRYVRTVAKTFRVRLDVPFRDLPKAARDLLLLGKGAGEIRVPWKEKRSEGVWKTMFRGLVPAIEKRYLESMTEAGKRRWGPYLSERTCPDCQGLRLREESRHVRVAGKTLPELSALTIREAAAWFGALALPGVRGEIAREVVREIRSRLQFLLDVGLGYLTLDRRGPTLSGGESQRIRLASQMGTELTGVVYVLDEPSIGLHPRDTGRLLATLRRLRDLGNTVLVVEHDPETVRAADWVVDFGPGAGRRGGEIVFAGTPADLERDARSLTGGYLSGRLSIEVPGSRREPGRERLVLVGASEHNLQAVTVEIPLRTLVAVTGVSGAGKSTLVNHVLVPALRAKLAERSPEGAAEPPENGNGPPEERAGAHRAIRGLEHLDKIVVVDQRPIGRTPRSNPATYTKAFDPIREFFAQLPESRAFGYTPSRFSFNVKGGRCESCQGDGLRRIEMHFLPDVFVPCEVCHGRRFTETTLRVKFRGLSIADVLDHSVAEALELFAGHPAIARVLATLRDVGVDYLALGQPAPTLSGGEAQRIKLSRELARRDTGRTLYVLDEPTVGLHPDDIGKLLQVLHRLVDAGNSVLVIEHNLDVVKVADWVLDLGPEGGDEGGRLVAEGPPEAIAACEASQTGRALRAVLPRAARTPAVAARR